MITAALVIVFFTLFLILIFLGVPAFCTLMAIVLGEICYMLIVGWPFWVILILIICLCKKGSK